jgi:hypothetical protein
MLSEFDTGDKISYKFEMQGKSALIFLAHEFAFVFAFGVGHNGKCSKMIF